VSKRLFIGNLAWSTTEDSLRAALEEGGRTCESVRIIMDRETGRPRGFAFAEMASEEDTQAVIGDLNGQELDGRPLRVNEAEDRPPRRDGGGGGGGGGGYRGGGGGGGGGWDGKRGGKRGDSGGGGGDSGGDSWGDNW
jgi:RNA recognition motif-containing protein